MWLVINIQMNYDDLSSTGTIKCDFEKDWCDFTTKNVGDDAAKKGFNWMRKNSNQVENQGLDGPDKGNIF